MRLEANHNDQANVLIFIGSVENDSAAQIVKQIEEAIHVKNRPLVCVTDQVPDLGPQLIDALLTITSHQLNQQQGLWFVDSRSEARRTLENVGFSQIEAVRIFSQIDTALAEISIEIFQQTLGTMLPEKTPACLDTKPAATESIQSEALNSLASALGSPPVPSLVPPKPTKDDKTKQELADHPDKQLRLPTAPVNLPSSARAAYLSDIIEEKVEDAVIHIKAKEKNHTPSSPTPFLSAAPPSEREETVFNHSSPPPPDLIHPEEEKLVFAPSSCPPPIESMTKEQIDYWNKVARGTEQLDNSYDVLIKQVPSIGSQRVPVCPEAKSRLARWRGVRGFFSRLFGKKDS